MAFNFQLLIDLHSEIERGFKKLYRYKFTVTAENLALLGDIGWTRDERLFQWWTDNHARFLRSWI